MIFMLLKKLKMEEIKKILSDIKEGFNNIEVIISKLEENKSKENLIKAKKSKKSKKSKKVKLKYNEYKDGDVMTMTFSECVENQIGMEQIGNKSKSGFSLNDLNKAKEYFEKIGCECELVNLNDLLDSNDNGEEEAYLLLIRDGVNKIYSKDYLNVYTNNDLYYELKNINWDDKYWDRRRSKVLNKNARVNMCVSNYSQEADYENKKGTVHNFKDLNLLNIIRTNLNSIGDSFKDMNAEGNWYYNLLNCGIGMHGDAERKKVLGVRLGNKSMNLCYRWYQKGVCIGKFYEVMLNPGDMYIMSEKATGNDWKKRKIKTLRHCCGGDGWMKNIRLKMKK